MKRNFCATACEILFPIILMILLSLVKSLFSVTDVVLDANDKEFLLSNSTAYLSLENLTTVPPRKDFYGLRIGNNDL
jgi:hypothetical protein